MIILVLLRYPGKGSVQAVPSFLVYGETGMVVRCSGLGPASSRSQSTGIFRIESFVGMAGLLLLVIFHAGERVSVVSLDC